MSLMVRSPFSNTPRYHVSSSSGKTSAASDRAVRGCPRGEWRGWGEQGHSLLVDAFNPSIYWYLLYVSFTFQLSIIFHLVSFDLICLFYLNRVESAPWRGHVWWSQLYWLVVYLPLWKILISWGYYSQYMEKQWKTYSKAPSSIWVPM